MQSRRFTPVSSRIATIHLETGQANKRYLNSVYAPTHAASGETLNELYGSLTVAIDARPPDWDLIIAGDFNSRVGIRESGKSHLVGPFGIAGATDRGLTLRTFCHIHNLLITNTYFPHRRCLYHTWTHPQSQRPHMIDFILASRRNKSRFTDTRAFHSARSWTDHSLVIGTYAMVKPPKKLRFSRKQQFSSSGTPRFNVARLRQEPVAERWEKALQRKMRERPYPQPPDHQQQQDGCM